MCIRNPAVPSIIFLQTLLNVDIDIPSKYSRLVQGYMAVRCQFVGVDGIDSFPVSFPNGVAQGSLPQPLTSCVFSNDLLNDFVNSQTSLYTDDLKSLSIVLPSNDTTSRNQVLLLMFNNWGQDS